MIYASRIARVVHEAASDAHKAGVMDKTTMREFDELCLAKVDELLPKDRVLLPKARAPIARPSSNGILNRGKPLAFPSLTSDRS